MKIQKSRRNFIKTSGLVTGTVLMGSFPSFAKTSEFILENETRKNSNNNRKESEWINYYIEKKRSLSERRKRTDILPLQGKKMKYGEKAFHLSLDLQGIDNLILSAKRADQEGNWDYYAAWGNARFITSEGKSVWLDEIPFAYERTNYDGATPKMKVNNKDEPIRIAGNLYEHGVFCFVNSVLAYPIEEKYVRFEAEIGIEDNSQKTGSVFFNISDVDMEVEVKNLYREYPEPIGALYAHSMQQGKNMEELLADNGASIEKNMVKELLKKLKGDVTKYQLKLRKTENEPDVRKQLTIYLTLFEQLRKQYKVQLEHDSKFSFIFLTDVHMHENNYRGSAEGFNKALEQVKLQDADFLLFGGDNAPIDHYPAGDERAENLMRNFKAMVDKTGQKAYYTVGNHDLVYTNGHMDEKSLQTYEKVFGPAYYSFNHKGIHFIILNSNERDGKGNFVIRSEQVEWLKKDLKEVDASVPVVLSMHVPLLSLYNPVIYGNYITGDAMFSNYKEIWDMLRVHNIGLVLQGHTHVYEEVFIRNTRFITGGAISDNWWYGGGWGDTFSGYVMIHVDHDNCFSWEYVCF